VCAGRAHTRRGEAHPVAHAGHASHDGRTHVRLGIACGGMCHLVRVKDIAFASSSLSVRAGIGGKDRTTFLPSRLHEPLKRHLLRVAERHKKDLSHGGCLAPMPAALARKYPSASCHWPGSSSSLRLCFALGATRVDLPAGMPRIRLRSGHSRIRSDRRGCASMRNRRPGTSTSLACTDQRRP
jgi:hypothetical protein